MTIGSSQIKEIVLNPAYCTSEDYHFLATQEVPVRWMNEDEGNDDDIFELIIDE